MILKPAACILLGLSLGLTATVASAAKRHKHRAYGPYAPVATAPAPYWRDPYMVPAKPGYWISSWGCVTDEGGGRVKPCETGGGGRN